MISRFMVVALCFLGPLTCIAHSDSVNSEATYISFAVPESLGTYPTGINAAMTVTGFYYVSLTATRGFLREADGTIITFGIPGEAATEPLSINAVGDVTGIAFNGNVSFGFVRYADGRIVTMQSSLELNPISINAFDELAGNNFENGTEGFTRSRAGVITAVSYPAGSVAPTRITGFNDSGTVVGYFADVSGKATTTASFIWHPDGYATSFVVPLAPGNATVITAAQSVNVEGAIVGSYSGAITQEGGTAIAGGFVRSPQGVIDVFQVPSSLVTSTSVGRFAGRNSLLAPPYLYINEPGDIAGTCSDAAGSQHGFVRNAYGTITTFDPPGGGETSVTGINDSGVIVGSHTFSWNVQLANGFLRLPQS